MCVQQVGSQQSCGAPSERNATLVLPVLTKQDVMEQAVTGILSGQITLSLASVEALLVLASAVGVSHMVLCASLQ